MFIYSLPRLVSMTSLFSTPSSPLLTTDTTSTINNKNTSSVSSNDDNNNSSNDSSSSGSTQPINRLKLVVSTLGAHGSILLRKRDTLASNANANATITNYSSNNRVNNNSNNTTLYNCDSSNVTSIDTGVVTVPSKLVPDTWVETKRSKSPLTLTQGVLRVTSSNCEKGHNYEDYDVIQ